MLGLFLFRDCFDKIVLFLINILNEDKLQMELLMIFLQDFILIFFQHTLAFLYDSYRDYSCSLSLFFVVYELKQFKQ